MKIKPGRFYPNSKEWEMNFQDISTNTATELPKIQINFYSSSDLNKTSKMNHTGTHCELDIKEPES